MHVMYRGGERVRTRVEEELLREEGLVLRALLLLYSVLGGKLNAKLWTQELRLGSSSTWSWTGNT